MNLSTAVSYFCNVHTITPEIVLALSIGLILVKISFAFAAISLILHYFIEQISGSTLICDCVKSVKRGQLKQQSNCNMSVVSQRLSTLKFR